MSKITTKSLEDVKSDMSELYEVVKQGGVDLRVAAELTNITGKYLKAVQLEVAREILLGHRSSGMLTLDSSNG